MTLKNTDILISGAGIAGPTLAYWLKRHGFNPTVVEKAPKLREGGYLIDFRGTGLEVAERMGVMPRVREEAYTPKETVFVDESSAVIARLDIARLFRETFDDPSRAQTQIMRSAFSRILHERSKDDVEYLFGDSISAIREDEQGIDVDFESGKSRRFDLVIGADGVHSNVRALSFGEESRLSRYLGYQLTSFFVNYPLPAGTVRIYTQPGKFVSLWGFPDNRAMTYIQFRQPEKLRYEPHDTETQKRLFAQAFADVRWDAMPGILDQLASARDFFFDSANLVELNRWSKGRVALIGDAGYPTPLTAWGVSLALIGGYILAGELKASGGDHRAAFDAYEREFRPFVERKTKGARRTGRSLVPGSAQGVWLRNQVLKVFSVSLISRLVARLTYGRMFRDSFALKDY